MVFACGDPLRGDDSAGPRAAMALPPDVLAAADVRIVGALEPEYLIDLPAHARVVIVDAVVGPPSGELVELDLAELSGHAAPVVTMSSHQLPLDRVVALGRVLRDEPIRGRFVGVGIGSVPVGAGLGESVSAALPALRDAVARAVMALR